MIEFYTPMFGFVSKSLRLVFVVNCHVILLTFFFLLPNKLQNETVSMKMKYRPGKCKTAPFCPKRREKKIDFKWQLQPNSKIKTQNQRSSSSSSVPSSKGSKRQWILFLFFPALFHFFLGFMLLDLDMLGFFFYGWICNFWNVFFFLLMDLWICNFWLCEFCFILMDLSGHIIVAGM